MLQDKWQGNSSTPEVHGQLTVSHISGEKCLCCGQSKHSRLDCPATELVCDYIKRTLFSAWCFSRKQPQQTSAVPGIEVINSDDNVNAVFLNKVVGSLHHDDGFMSKIKEIDKCHELQEISWVLCGPDKRALPLVGGITAPRSILQYR